VSSDVISKNPDVLSGTAVFMGTRVPIKALMDHLEAGDRLDDFLEDFPTVSRAQAVAVLELACEKLTGTDDEAAA